MGSKTRAWIESHKDYPHEDWCLVWPFAREPRVDRGMMDDEWAHRVMCEAVHGPAPPDKPQAAHSCGNGDLGCVNPRHLSWASNSENQLQRYAQGRGNPNAHGNKSMFTPAQIEEIRSRYGEFTQTKLAEMYGCSLGTPEGARKIADQLVVWANHAEAGGNAITAMKWIVNITMKNDPTQEAAEPHWEIAPIATGDTLQNSDSGA